MFPIARALRLFLVGMCATALVGIALVGTACSTDDGDDGDAATTTEASGVTVDNADEGPPEASVTGSAMDLLREAPEFSSFRSSVEGTRYEEQLECFDDEEALTRGWTIVLAPVDDAFDELAADGPAFDAESGFGDLSETFTAAAGVPDGTEVTFDADGGVGAMTWTAEAGSGGDEAGDDVPATPDGTQYVVFAVEDGRAVLPTDTDLPPLPSIATCGAASTLQLLVLGATVAEPDDPSSGFPDVVPDED